MQAIIIDGLAIHSVTMEKPAEWRQFDGQWAIEVNDVQTDASILIGVDQTVFLPVDKLNSAHFPIQTPTARLMTSTLTGKLIAFGHNITQHKVTSAKTSVNQQTPVEDIINIESDFSNSDDNENKYHSVQINTVSQRRPWVFQERFDSANN